MYTASPLELLWTMLALIGLAVSVIMNLYARGDKAYIELRHELQSAGKLPPKSPLWYKQITRLAKGCIRRENANVYLEFFLFYLGVRAILLPPNPGDTDVWTVTTGVLFIIASPVLTYCAIKDYRERRTHDQELDSLPPDLDLTGAREEESDAVSVADERGGLPPAPVYERGGVGGDRQRDAGGDLPLVGDEPPEDRPAR